MTRPECPNCLRPKATREDSSAYTGDGSVPHGWPDSVGSHLCWETPCDNERPAEFDLSPAEIRDLRAGFAAAWAEVEALQRDAAVAWDALLSISGELKFCGSPNELAAAVIRMARERDEALTDAEMQRQAVTYEVAAANTLRRERDEAQAACAVMREALELMDVNGDRQSIHAPEDPAVKALCDRVGYGAVMDSAARQWRAMGGIMEVGAFLSGPCIGTVKRALASDAGRPLLERLEKAEARADNAEADLQRERERADGLHDALKHVAHLTLDGAGHYRCCPGLAHGSGAHLPGCVVGDALTLGKDPTHEPG